NLGLWDRDCHGAGDGHLAEADPRPFGEVGAGVPVVVQRAAARRARQPRRAGPPVPGAGGRGAGGRGAGCASRAACRRSAMIFNGGQILAYLPMMILIGMGCVVLLAETFVHGTQRAGLAWLGIAGCVAALAAVAGQWQ